MKDIDYVCVQRRDGEADFVAESTTFCLQETTSGIRQTLAYLLKDLQQICRHLRECATSEG